MKRSIACILALAALALTAPIVAIADPGGRGGGHGHGGGGRGGWEGGGGRGWQGGGPGRGGFERGGSFERGGGFEGQGRWRGRPDDGDRGGERDRWSGGREGERYAPRPRMNSLGEGWREQQDEARAGVRSGQFRPLSGVLSDLRRRQPGRQLDAGIEQGRDGRPVYRVRWAARNGQRIDYIVDARTGAILAEEGR